MATNSRGVSAAFAVLFALVLAAAWFLLDDDDAANVPLVPPTDDTTIEPGAPLVITDEPTEMDGLVETTVADDQVVELTGNRPTPAPTDEWSIHWHLVDQLGEPVFEEQLINVGAAPIWGRPLPLRITDASGFDDVPVMFDREGRWTSTSRAAPVALTIDLGHVTFRGIATQHGQQIELRATGSLDPRDMAPVSFKGNLRVGTVVWMDRDTGRRQVVVRSSKDEEELVGWFPPGRYAFAAISLPVIDAVQQDAMGEFTLPDTSPKTIHVTFAGETTVVGKLVPPPRGSEEVRVVANARGPWFGLRHRSAFVDHRGDFKIKNLPPGEYSWSIERRAHDVWTLSTALSFATVVEGVNHITVADAGVSAEGRLVVNTNGKGGVLLVSTDGRFRTVLPARHDASETYVLPRGEYEYTMIGEPPAKPTYITGTVTLGLEPVELTLDLSVDD